MLSDPEPPTEFSPELYRKLLDIVNQNREAWEGFIDYEELLRRAKVEQAA